MAKATTRGGRSPNPRESQGLGAGPAQPRVHGAQVATVGQLLALGGLLDSCLGLGPGNGPTHAAVPYPPREDSGQELWPPAAVNRLGIPGLVVDSKEVMTSRPLAKAPDVLNGGVDRGVLGVGRLHWPAEG